MDEQKQQLVEKLKSANNILVTVSSNPSVDQLAACVGLTIALNKLDKHATAVFSGEIPDTIDFLKPEATIEKNTDSLRDFIIALDKAKADKLRYKVEDKVVKIFITPYRTSISEDDLNFSQGDFNVDVVVALGVHQQQDLDQAITAHGRILHDATVMVINNSEAGELGSVNWVDTTASSLSELTAILVKDLDKKLTDQQIATALLTGIVAATDRFRDQNTTARTMSVSADLMSAGANQQLVTSELEHSMDVHANGDSEKPKSKDKPTNEDNPKESSEQGVADGTLEIDHQAAKEPESDKPDTPEQDKPAPEDSSPDQNQDAVFKREAMTSPPTFGAALTANDRPEESGFQPSPDLAKSSNDNTLLKHDAKLPPVNTETHDDQPPQQPAPDNEPADSGDSNGALSIEPPPRDVGDLPSLHSAPPAPPTPPSPSTPPAPPTLPQTTPQPEKLWQPPTPPAQPTPPPPAQPAAAPEHSDQAAPEANSPDIDVEAAKAEVLKALSEQPDEAPAPIAGLNAQPLGEPLHQASNPEPAPQPQPPELPTLPSTLPSVDDQPPVGANTPLDMPLPPQPAGGVNVPPPQVKPPTDSPATSGKPPEVPPPLPPGAWPQ